MGPNQTYKCLHSKGNHQQNEKTWMEEIFANAVTDKSLISQIYKQLIQCNNKKTKQSNHKMARSPK